MDKIAIFYGPQGGNTEKVAIDLAKTFGENDSILLQVKDATEMDIEPYKNIIFGGPTVGSHTWRDDKGQTDWDQFLVRLSEMDLSGKKCAIFGLGDHIAYAHHFVDDIGVMADRLEKAGASLVGVVPIDGYEFEASKAQRGDVFLGLPIDEDYEADKTEVRLGTWVDQLRKEFV
ncbi:MAG: flavodoxin [Bacteroidales bacterium]|nr:flavodoxin [Bacteroidales bacterium]